MLETLKLIGVCLTKKIRLHNNFLFHNDRRSVLHETEACLNQFGVFSAVKMYIFGRFLFRFHNFSTRVRVETETGI